MADDIDTILNDYTIHGVTAFKCKDNTYMVATLKRRISDLILQARIDELENINPAASHSIASTVDDRIKQLFNTKDAV